MTRRAPALRIGTGILLAAQQESNYPKVPITLATRWFAAGRKPQTLKPQSIVKSVRAY